MSIIINREAGTFMFPSHEHELDHDGVDQIVSRVKGAVALLIDDEGEFYYLVDAGRGSLEWMAIEDCIPAKTRRKYPKQLAEVTSLRTPEDTQ